MVIDTRVNELQRGHHAVSPRTSTTAESNLSIKFAFKNSLCTAYGVGRTNGGKQHQAHRDQEDRVRDESQPEHEDPRQAYGSLWKKKAKTSGMKDNATQ
jgi:hypothetical protein